MLVALIISVVILLCAPLVSAVVAKRPSLSFALDGFVLVVASGLVVLTLLPEALSVTGLAGLAIAAIGFSLPWIAETLFDRSSDRTHRTVLIIASVALIFHAGSDGLLLALAGFRSDAHWLIAGIFIHRLGVAMTIWWLLKPVAGPLIGYLVIMAMAAATLLFYGLTETVVQFADHKAMGFLQAFAAGSLLHVILHPVHRKDEQVGTDNLKSQTSPWSYSHQAGTALGVIFWVAVIVIYLVGHVNSTADAGFDNNLSVISHTHSLDILLAVGDRVAPFFGLALAVTILQSHWPWWSRHKKKPEILKAVSKVSSWSVAIWILLSYAASVFISAENKMMLNSTPWLWICWMGIVVSLMIREGARTFLGRLVPSVFIHHHQTSEHICSAKKRDV